MNHHTIPIPTIPKNGESNNGFSNVEHKEFISLSMKVELESLDRTKLAIKLIDQQILYIESENNCRIM